MCWVGACGGSRLCAGVTLICEGPRWTTRVAASARRRAASARFAFCPRRVVIRNARFWFSINRKRKAGHWAQVQSRQERIDDDA